MAFYRTETQNKATELYGVCYNHQFDPTIPWEVIADGETLLLPLGEGTVQLTNVASGTVVNATYNPTEDLISSSTIHTITPDTTVSFATGKTSGAAFNIICFEYIDAHTLFIMYNWATSATKLSITYSRILYACGSVFKMSNADSTFAASLISRNASTAGSCYSGFLCKTDYDGCFNRMGIAYIRQHITAANVLTSQTLWHGYIAAHVTAQGSYRYITKSLNSTLQVTASTSVISLGNSDSNMFIAKANTSYRYYFHRDSNVAAGTGGMANLFRTSGQGYAESSSSINGYSIIGKLSDGNLIACTKLYETYHSTGIKGMYNSHCFKSTGSRTNIYILDYDKSTASTSMYTIQEIQMPADPGAYCSLICLDGDIICFGSGTSAPTINYPDAYSDRMKYGLYQVRKTYDGSSYSYSLLELGPVKFNLHVSSRTQVATNVYKLDVFPKFTGLYSNTFNKVSAVSYSPKAITSDVTPLSTSRRYLVATTVRSYALFGGGRTRDSKYSSTVDAYNESLTRSTPAELSVARYYFAATAVGGYALFGGGYAGNTSTYYSTVDAYDESLTRSNPTELSYARGVLAATTVGGYALFGGGSPNTLTVDAYDESLTRSNTIGLSVARNTLAATTLGGYALFGGGYGSGYRTTVDAYDQSLTRSTPAELSVARAYFAATTVGVMHSSEGGTEQITTQQSMPMIHRLHGQHQLNFL